MRTAPRLLGLVLALVLGACGRDGGPPTPTWAAALSKEQVVEAARVGVPVAFENTIGMRFVLIPAGTFTMGSPADEPDREDTTENVHSVTLTRPYYLQTTEVTNAQFRRYRSLHDSGQSMESMQGPYHSLNADEQPAVNLAREEAIEFTRWLSEKDPGHEYRLPTEAEWERACRAGTQTPFWWGSTISTEQANFGYRDQDGYGGVLRPIVSRKATVPVGSLPPSPWGLFEVHGNAREWCSDFYNDEDYPPGPAVDPVAPPRDEKPVAMTRGGAYQEAGHMVRAAFRIGVQDGSARPYVGFRVAVSVAAK